MFLLDEVKALIPLRKWYLVYQFATKFCNVFMIAVTLSLLISIWGTHGAILNSYITPMLGMIVLLPYIGKAVLRLPLISFKYAIVAEIFASCMYGAAALGYSPEIAFCLGLLTFTWSNALMEPLRTKITSQVIAGESAYALLSTRVNSIFIVFITSVGIILLEAQLSVIVNLIGVAIMLFISRASYFKVMDNVDLK